VNGRILVMIPTRDRPQELDGAVESVHQTSSLADVVAYVDDDQVDLYRSSQANCYFHHGPRIGPVAAANAIVKQMPGYSAYGLITDDSRMISPGWDGWLLEVVDQFPNKICVVSPHHNQGNHVDMPFVSRKWIDVVGWFACPACHHHAWPIITGLIGEMTAIVHSPRQMFALVHPHKTEMVSVNKMEHDHRAFFEFVSLKLPAVVETVRTEMGR
jgi:hypothetical protein